jgi:hypothetical protein
LLYLGILELDKCNVALSLPLKILICTGVFEKVESPQTLNRYSYCLNNPLKYVDPRGLDCEFVILPDGTISYKLADLYNKMQKALNSMTEGPFQKYQDAQNYALILGMSKDEAEDWAKGYLMGYSLGEYLSRFKNGTYLRIAKHCFKEEAWNNLCEYIFLAMVSGYPIVLPIPVPWWVELGLYAQQIYDIFKNAWN